MKDAWHISKPDKQSSHNYQAQDVSNGCGALFLQVSRVRLHRDMEEKAPELWPLFIGQCFLSTGLTKCLTVETWRKRLYNEKQRSYKCNSSVSSEVPL